MPTQDIHVEDRRQSEALVAPMQTETGARDDRQENLGQNDAKVGDYIANIGKTVGSRLAHAFDPMIEQYEKLFKEGARTPVLRLPSDYGMDYEDCYFPSADGIPLEAWYIPAVGSNKLLEPQSAIRNPQSAIRI